MSAVLEFEPVAGRYNIYRIIHKGLRGFMTDTLLRVGRMDVNDACEVGETIEQARALLTLCGAHLQHENDFVHPAMEAGRAGSTHRIADEHVEHVTEIRALEQQIATFEAVPSAALSTELYLDLSLFVAENFEHMVVEETHHHGVLVDKYSDQELLDLERRIVASMPPEKAMVALRWMLPHINADERVFMLGDMKLAAPPEVFNGVMTLARELLSQRDFYKLERALA